MPRRQDSTQSPAHIAQDRGGSPSMHHKKCVHPVVPREGRASPTLPSPSLIYADTVRRVLFPVSPTEATERTEMTEVAETQTGPGAPVHPSTTESTLTRQARLQDALPPVSSTKASEYTSSVMAESPYGS